MDASGGWYPEAQQPSQQEHQRSFTEQAGRWEGGPRRRVQRWVFVLYSSCRGPGSYPGFNKCPSKSATSKGSAVTLWSTSPTPPPPKKKKKKLRKNIKDKKLMRQKSPCRGELRDVCLWFSSNHTCWQPWRSISKKLYHSPAPRLHRRL